MSKRIGGKYVVTLEKANIRGIKGGSGKSLYMKLKTINDDHWRVWIDLREHDKLMELYNTIGSLWK
jgi:hypothetical protein